MKLRLLILSVALSLPVIVAAQGLDTAKIDEAMGRSGQQTGDVYRLGFPRTDLHVSVDGVEIKPGLGLGSWAAFAGNDNAAMVMGDLVLLENELTPVMKKLRAAGFDITAVHNHVLKETPRVIYMHYMGHGKGVELAKALHAALAESKTPLDKPAPPATTAEPPGFVKTIEDTLGTKGHFAGGCAFLRDSSWSGDHRSRNDTDRAARRSRGDQLPGGRDGQSCDNRGFRVDGGGS